MGSGHLDRDIVEECKFEGALLWEAKAGLSLRQTLKIWFDPYNNWHPHQALDYRTTAKEAAGNRK